MSEKKDSKRRCQIFAMFQHSSVSAMDSLLIVLPRSVHNWIYIVNWVQRKYLRNFVEYIQIEWLIKVISIQPMCFSVTIDFKSSFFVWLYHWKIIKCTLNKFTRRRQNRNILHMYISSLIMKISIRNKKVNCLNLWCVDIASILLHFVVTK